MDKQYKLVHNKTKEETICEKVVIDNFDYYASEEKPIKNTYFIEINNDGTRNSYTNKIYFCDIGETDNFILTTEINFPFPENCKKIIATNNPSIDIVQVIDEVEKIKIDCGIDYVKYKSDETSAIDFLNGYNKGYNKAKETYHFIEQDMIDFSKFIIEQRLRSNVAIKDLLQIFKEQQIKTIYYE